MTTPSRHSNLPGQLTSFVGREQEREAAAAALASTRLLILTGAGGSGKTRLAIELAIAAGASFVDGTWWVDLAPVTEAEQVALALTTVLDVRPLPGRTHTEAAVQELASRRALVVLDNCEHLTDAAADLCEVLLHGCPQVVVLATSRSPLRVPGESDWRVPPLLLPTADTPAAISESDAGALFVSRALLVSPEFALDDQNASAVERICRDVDGLPLAIELAAARIRMLTPHQIADGLSDRFTLLSGGPRNSVQRQQTLRASVDWSYELLSGPARTLFRSLAVFVGGWTLDAVRSVCAPNGAAQAAPLDVLASLVDNSLVVVEPQGAEVRYRLLETVRSYALELLEQSGEAGSLADRHVNFFADLATRAEREIHTPEVRRWLEILDRDAANISAALAHALARHPERALEFSTALTGWWRLRGHFGTGQRALALALDATDSVPSPRRARALWGCGFLARFAGDVENANRYSADALAMAEAISDDWTLASSLQSTASLRMLRAPGASQALFARALAHASATGDSWLILAVLVNTARGFLMTDDFDDAERVLAEAEPLLAMGAEASSQLGSSAAWCALARGRLAESLATCERTAVAAGELGDPVSRALSDMVAAWVELHQGRADFAVDRMRASESRMIAQGAFIAIPTARIELGRALAALGRLDEAQEVLAGVVASRADEGWHYVRALLAYADVLRAAGDPAAAAGHATEALETSRTVGCRSHLASAQQLLAQVQLDEGAFAEAEALLRDALDQRAELDAPIWMAQSFDALARAAAGLESHLEAVRLLGAAERVRRDLGQVRWALDATDMTDLEQSLRATLGIDDFDAAFAAGMELPLEAAVKWIRRSRGTRKRPSAGWESLTPTEHRVVELAATGLTNPEIAERMFISRGTVKAHLEHVFNKLGVRSRAELAALSARRAT